MGQLGWSPSEFWQASMFEFHAATDGLAAMHGAAKPEPITRAELQDLMERYPD